MSEIREHFVSRFSPGALLEADYSQLEVYVLAHLSRDKQLKQDLLDGKDLHAISATNLFGPHFSANQRRIAKQLSFQLQYGSSAKGMADKMGIPRSMATKFIEQYFERYPRVRAYHTELADTILTNRFMPNDPDHTPGGFPIGVSWYGQDTGRKYTFFEEEAPAWSHASTSFRPTRVKNYAVQGFAGGDIVLTSVGKLLRVLKNDPELEENALLINTIHDSVMVDCTFEVMSKAAKTMKEILEDAPKYLKQWYNIDFDLPLKVEIKAGKTWNSMNKITV